MTLQEFLEIWNGKSCEVAGSANAKNQCVDLANAYLREVCNHSIVEWTNACDFPSKIKDMEWVVNDEESDLPLEGDIIIWNSNVGSGSGHIAIFLDGTTSKFNSFDQNWPLYSPCHVQPHTYTNVIGWLRPKLQVEESMTEEQKRILAFIGGRTEGEVREAFGALADQPNLIKQITDLKSYQENLNSQITELNVKLAISEKNASDWQTQLKTANKTNQTLSADVAYYQPYKALYENALKKTIDKYSALELLSMGIKLLFQKSNK